MIPRTYAQIAASAHLSGGQTQTEATALMSRRVLSRSSVGFLASILHSLRQEGAACTTEAEYTLVRAQVERVRDALGRKGAL